MSYDLEKDIEKLNSFLRGELSAVETYEQAIAKVDDPQIKSVLTKLQASHSDRVKKLQSKIAGAGGTPDTDSGAWGSFAKLVEGSAKAFGSKAAITALEEGEDHGRNDYQRDLDELTPPIRAWIEREILPAQLATHDALSRIQSSV